MQNNNWTKVFAHYVILIFLRKIKVKWNKKLYYLTTAPWLYRMSHMFSYCLLYTFLKSFGYWTCKFPETSLIFLHNSSFVENGCPLYKFSFRILQMFSIRDKSGLYGGQSKTCTPFAAKKDIGVFLTWDLALSYWNQNLLYFAFNKEKTSSFRNPQYFPVLRVPFNFRRSTSPLREIQPQTITEPSRNGLCRRLLVIFFANVL